MRASPSTRSSRHARCLAIVLLAATISCVPLPVAHAEEPTDGRLTAVPFTQVQLADAFWAPRIQTNREVSLPHNFKWCEDTGRISNFAKAGGLVDGKFEGIYFNDSDVYKVLQGAAYSLAAHPDPVLDKMTDDVIAKIAAAQQENGYVNCFYTLVEPDKKWTNLRVRHELYCAGHMFEAAAAHYRATGKRTFLDVALRFADRIDDIFGPDKRHDVPGHEEIELALVELYNVTGEKRYLDLARFFLDVRGDETKREHIYGPYCQDHQPVREQSEVVGHAVRAMYLYAGVADVAALTDDQGFVDAMDRIWEDITLRKLHITGGVGARHGGEAFGEAYELPNESAYCETCASIGLVLFAHRLNLLHADAQYVDVVEQALYNGVLSGIDLDGAHYFYVNPLASAGNHHRQPFYGCACCPTNVARTVPSVPGYAYATDDSSIYVNLYAAGTARVEVAGQTVEVTQETNYPWDGHVKITLKPERPAKFDLCLRVPGWCEEAEIDEVGKWIEETDDKGYERFRNEWSAGDTIEMSLAMPIERIEAHPKVTADRGRVAVRRGPIVYCFEAVDNGPAVRNLTLPADPKFTAKHRPDLLGGVTVIEGVDSRGNPITAVPYHVWDHREAGGMIVWPRQAGKNRQPDEDDPTWSEQLYRPLDPSTLGPPEPLGLMERLTPTASHGGGGAWALCDDLTPSDSCDHSIPRFTWWDHRSTTEWVQYDFDEPTELKAVEVYWFDDSRMKRDCRVPASWKLLYREGDAWKPVVTTDPLATTIDQSHRVTFTPVTTTALRIEVELQEGWSGGILEWRVE